MITVGVIMLTVSVIMITLTVIMITVPLSSYQFGRCVLDDGGRHVEMWRPLRGTRKARAWVVTGLWGATGGRTYTTGSLATRRSRSLRTSSQHPVPVTAYCLSGFVACFRAYQFPPLPSLRSGKHGRSPQGR